jgi:putative hemolysin
MIKMKVGWVGITLISIILLIEPLVFGLRNPAAVYCEALGYEYVIEETPEGEVGVCKLPDDSTCTDWDFLIGKCGKEYSYCKKEGYELKIINDTEKCGSIFTEECMVCVLEDGSEVEVTKLMGLDFREGICGDGVCVLGESYKDCPQDCPSGSFDGYCDKVKDDRCDPDCEASEDPDCVMEEETTTTIIIITTTTVTTTTTIFKPKCGDGVCDEEENYRSCQKDCPSGSLDGYCDGVKDEVCDPDCSRDEDVDCEKEEEGGYLSYLLWLILGLIILGVVIFLVFSMIKKGGSEKDDELLEWIKEKLREGEDPNVLKKGLRDEGYDPNLVNEAEKKLW